MNLFLANSRVKVINVFLGLIKSAPVQLQTLAFLIVSTVIIGLNQNQNFDFHHDGLMTSNFIEIRNSFQNDGSWPFNQYGAAWLLPYLPVILSGEVDSMYRRAGLVSILILSLTLLTSLKVAGKFVSKVKVLFVPVVLAATASLGNLRTWPSVTYMLFLSCFLLASVSYFSERVSSRYLNRNAFFMGSLIPLIILSRVQVGIFLLLAFSVVVSRYGPTKTRRYFYLGLTLITIVCVFYLTSQNWLTAVFNDSFVYSLNYLTGDETRVLPIFTAIGAVVVFLFLYLLSSDGLSIKRARPLILVTSCGFGVLIALYIVTVLSEGSDSVSLYVILMRRLFVSILIGSFLFFSFSYFSLGFKEPSVPNSVQKSRELTLLLVGAASLLQLVPLFDSTHAWWSSPPLIIILLLLLDKLIKKYFKSIKLNGTVVSLAMATVLLLTFTIQSHNNEKSRLVSFDAQFMSDTLGFQSDVTEQTQLFSMVSRTAPRASKILNLCINGNIFLTSQGYQSASRFYVTWPNMHGYPEFISAINASRPDFILTCSVLPEPAVGFVTEEDRSNLRTSQESVIQQIYSQPILLDQFESIRNVQWQLWSGEK